MAEADAPTDGSPDDAPDVPPDDAPADRRRDDDELLRPLGTVVERLLTAAEDDPQLRAALRQVATHVLDRTAVGKAGESADAADAGAPAQASQKQSPTARPAAEVDPAEITSPPRNYEQRFFAAPASNGIARPRPPAPRTPPPRPAADAADSGEDAEARSSAPPSAVRDEDLPLIERRCRLKAEAARWAETRRRRLADEGDSYADIEQEDQAIIARAKALPDCFLWMCHPAGPQPAEPAAWREIAECFDTLAEALGLIRQMLADAGSDRDLFEPAVKLLAEAQSTVRTAVARIGGRDDHDQYKVHRWLGRITSEQSIYIERYMKADDPADPAGLPELKERVQQLEAHWSDRDGRRRRRQAGFNRIRYHLDQLDDRPLNPEHDWSVIFRTVDGMVEEGMPPSDVKLRRLLLPRMDDMPAPEQMPQGMRRVLDEIDRYLATRPSADADNTPAAVTPEVVEVRRLLEGRAAVMIGGQRRRESERNLKQAFGLRELVWLNTSPHQPLSDFEPAIMRPDVAVVLLAIRWSSHSYGQLKETCDRVGKPLVRLPAGYGVNRVAAEILTQCSEQLKAGPVA